MSLAQIPQKNGLPAFSSINTDTIIDSVKDLLAHCKKVTETVIAAGEYSWSKLVMPIDEADDLFDRYWAMVSHMNSVVSTDELREAHDACLPLISEHSTWAGQHQGVYNAYQSLAESEEFAGLTQAQQKAISNTLRNFKLSGVALPDEKKKRYAEIQSRLSELSSVFSNNVMDATQAWTKLVEDESELAGLPNSTIEAAAQEAGSKDLSGWLFTLNIPSYLPVMMYSENRELREEMYRAYVTRASEIGPNGGEFDNTKVIKETLILRQEEAKLLEFDTYADSSLATKMAENTTQVDDFLKQLADKSLPQAKAEMQEIKAYARDEFGAEDIQAWDLAFYAEKLKQSKYTISDEMLRPYFPEDTVVKGLFEIVHRLFGLNIEEKSDVDTWHKDVRYFEIKDSSGQLRGSFYLDLYAREKKRCGAWMDNCKNRALLSTGEMQAPIAFLTCNFNGPVGDKPALFTHDEVITLFHEFGHGIHHMLTRVDVFAVSGINGVAWDAVELPSQFLENWCWEEEALAFISGHYETGEPLPGDLLEKMLAAKNFQSAMQMVRQIEFSIFDFGLHQADAEQVDVQAYLNDVRSKVAVVTPPEFNRFQNSFGHIFAGGYAAGYYSYKWAEVLSADAFSRFEEEGIFSQEAGQSFLHNVLEMGGSREPMELFVAFRGREPNIDALLRHSGIAA